MKKLIALVLALVCILGIVGCDQTKTESIDFPFSIEDVTNIEMYHFDSTLGNAEKRLSLTKTI